MKSCRPRRTPAACVCIVVAALCSPALADPPVVVDATWALAEEIDFDLPVAPHYSPVDGLIHLGRSSSGTDGLYRIEADGSFTLLADASNPSGVAIDPTTGDIFVSEAFGGEVFRTAFGTTGRELWVTGFHSGDDDPVGMAIAPAGYAGGVVPPGDALVADFGFSGLDEIWRFSTVTPEGETVVHADDGTLTDCYDVAFGGDTVWTIDDPGRVLTLAPDGTLTEFTLSAPIPTPLGIAVDPIEGDLYVLDGGDVVGEGRVVRVDPVTGDVTEIVTGLVLGSTGTIRSFAAIDFSPDGLELVFAERDEDRVWILRRCDLVLEDCDGDGIEDACAIADELVSDCNFNGIPDSCDIADGTSGDCNEDGVPDECPQCPPVEVVIVFDTSSSMSGEGAALCDKVGQVIAQLNASGVDVTPTIWGISETPGGGFSCLTDTVIDALGTVVPGSPPPGIETLGDCPGGSQIASEDWGRAVAVVAGLFPWSPDSLRLVIPLSDEGAWCGDRSTELDDLAIQHAITVAQAAGVVVSPVAASGSSGAVIAQAEAIAAATGGQAFQSSESADDLADGILNLILDACTTITDCNDNNVPDDCDIAEGTSLDLDGDGIPDECQCPADLDDNGVVDFNDLLVVLANWDAIGGDGDVDGDGVTGFGDLLAVLAAWGPCT